MGSQLDLFAGPPPAPPAKDEPRKEAAPALRVPPPSDLGAMADGLRAVGYTVESQRFGPWLRIVRPRDARAGWLHRRDLPTFAAWVAGGSTGDEPTVQWFLEKRVQETPKAPTRRGRALPGARTDDGAEGVEPCS